jgi:hypothetical protein
MNFEIVARKSAVSYAGVPPAAATIRVAGRITCPLDYSARKSLYWSSI